MPISCLIYFEGHVGRVDHTKDSHKHIGKHASSQKDDSQYKEQDDYVSRPNSDDLSQFVARLESRKMIIYCVEERIQYLFNLLKVS